MTFKQMIDLILTFEGGYSFDPRDPGGETNYGISKRSYPLLNIKALTREKAVEIYYRDYYLKNHIDMLPSSLQLMALDTAILHGSSVLHELLSQDPTMWVDLPDDTLLFMAEERRKRFYKSKNWAVYGKGWMRRLLVISLRSIIDANPQE